MNKIVSVVFFITLVTQAVAQQQPKDTVVTKPFERYWTKPRIVPRIGAGFQDNFFGEVGIAYHKIYVHPLTLASAAPYLSVDAFAVDDDLIIGPKLGYEVTAGLFGLAADVTYYTDFEREQVVITPKAGISLLGFANLFYGRNISLSDDSFKSISPNRFSLVFNINRDYFDLRDARRKGH